MFILSKGYEKAYEYDKSEGKKMSYGKKAKDEKMKYEDKHGLVIRIVCFSLIMFLFSDKHGHHKKAMKGKDNYGKKMNKGEEVSAS